MLQKLKLSCPVCGKRNVRTNIREKKHICISCGYKWDKEPQEVKNE